VGISDGDWKFYGLLKTASQKLWLKRSRTQNEGWACAENVKKLLIGRLGYGPVELRVANRTSKASRRGASWHGLVGTSGLSSPFVFRPLPVMQTTVVFVRALMAILRDERLRDARLLLRCGFGEDPSYRQAA